MAQAIIDASVALKWVLPETARGSAEAVFLEFQAGRIDLLAPPLFLADVAGAPAKGVRRSLLTQAMARTAYQWIATRCPRFVQEPGDTASAFELALERRISFWDSCYLALAIRYRCDLITADVRLARAVAPHDPFVRLLD